MLWQKQNLYSFVKIVGLNPLSGWAVVPQCGEWNTLVEEIIKETKHSRTPSQGVGNQTAKPTSLPDIEISSIARVSTTFGEIDPCIGWWHSAWCSNAFRW